MLLQDYQPNAGDWLSSYWKGFMSPDQMARIRNTGVPMDFLKEVSLLHPPGATCYSSHKQSSCLLVQQPHMHAKHNSVCHPAAHCSLSCCKVSLHHAFIFATHSPVQRGLIVGQTTASSPDHFSDFRSFVRFQSEMHLSYSGATKTQEAQSNVAGSKRLGVAQKQRTIFAVALALL